MDFNQLQTLLQAIQLKQQKIKVVVDYILMNTSLNQPQIAASLYQSFNNYNIQKQLSIFFTISQILLISSKKRDLAYFKAFGNKLRPLVEKLANQIEDTRHMKDVCRTLDKWQTQQLFATNFIQKLKMITKHFYEKIRQEQYQTQGNLLFGGFKKYKKTFLMELSDIKNYDLLKEIYDNYAQYQELEQKLTSLNVQFLKIDFTEKDIKETDNSNKNNNSKTDEISRRRSQELLKIYRQTRQKLQNLLVKIQKSFIKLRSWTLKQYQNVKNQYQFMSGSFKDNGEEQQKAEN